MKTFKFKAILSGVMMCAFMNNACATGTSTEARPQENSEQPTVAESSEVISDRADMQLSSSIYNTSLSPVFILALARKETDAIINIIAQMGNKVPNPYHITDIYLCLKADVSKVLSIIGGSNNRYKKIMTDNIKNFCEQNLVKNDSEILWGIDTCNTVKELYNVVTEKAPVITIRPLDDILRKPGTFYYRNFKTEALRKLSATDIITTFSQNITSSTVDALIEAANTIAIIGKAIKEKDIMTILKKTIKYGIEQKDILVSCTRIAQYLQSKGVIKGAASDVVVYPEMMVSLAGSADVIGGSAYNEDFLIEVESPMGCPFFCCSSPDDYSD